MTRLIPDQQVPDLTFKLVGGETYRLADENPENFSLVIFYRGLHCPVCKTYLSTLNGLLGKYAGVGVTVVAVSMNDEAAASKTREEWGLDKLRLGYGLDEASAKAWNLYLSTAMRDTEPPVFCEPGFFLVRPDNRLYMINVANMPWGRPDLDVMADKIAFAVDKAYPARGSRA